MTPPIRERILGRSFSPIPNQLMGFLGYFLILMLAGMMVLPFVEAATISINASSAYVEDSAATVYVAINDETPFSGTVSLASTNLQLSASEISVSSGGFIGTHFNTSITITGSDPGAYSLSATLTNSSTSSTLATFNTTGNINSSAPQILSSSPSGIVSKDNTILIIQTNEVAACRYSTSNATYDSMASFANTDSTRHNQTLTSLTEGAYAYSLPLLCCNITLTIRQQRNPSPSQDLARSGKGTSSSLKMTTIR